MPAATPVWASLNLKGGVGKTHAVWLLAGVAEERGVRTLVVDLDTQGNVTNSLLPARDDRPCVEALFDPAGDAEAAGLVRPSTLAGVDILPSGPHLARFDLADQTAWEGADLHLSLVDAFADLAGDYDLIVCDCPPRLSLVSFAALAAATGVVVPLEAADWGAQGVVQVTEAVRYVRRRFNPGLELLGYLVSRFKTRRKYQREYLASLHDHFGGLAFDIVIPDRAKFEQSVTERVPITRYSARSAEADLARQLFDETARRAGVAFWPREAVGR